MAFLVFLQTAANEIHAKFLLPLPRLPRCQSVSQKGEIRAFSHCVLMGSQSLAPPSSCLPRDHGRSLRYRNRIGTEGDLTLGLQLSLSLSLCQQKEDTKEADTKSLETHTRPSLAG